jgi:hypothetical protein
MPQFQLVPPVQVLHVCVSLVSSPEQTAPVLNSPASHR